MAVFVAGSLFGVKCAKASTGRGRPNRRTSLANNEATTEVSKNGIALCDHFGPFWMSLFLVAQTMVCLGVESISVSRIFGDTPCGDGG